jgi:DNA-binding transcriptional LysR family regulator
MEKFSLHELRCFDSVVSAGSFQAAARKLRRTHPSVFAAVRNLERRLAVQLLDRSGYRVGLTPEGRSFILRARALLRETAALDTYAMQLAMGEESELRVVIGDLCPLRDTLALLRQFFDACPSTRLHLHFEAISGPWERLFDGDADLILHHVDPSDGRLEFIELSRVRLVPVVAPGFLPFPISPTITPEQMREFSQCVIRDTARHSAPRDYFVLEGARHWTVADQLMKKEVIVQGMGWGHMPEFLIERELRLKQLLSIAGKHLPGGAVTIVAARRRDAPQGPVAGRLWHYIEQQASKLRSDRRRKGRIVSRPR